MKIPFLNFSRKARALEVAPAASPKTGGRFNLGGQIQSPVFQPEHARQLREYADSNRRMIRMYDAAITTNLNADFSMTTGSANAEILSSLYMVRGRSRTLVKDNPTSKGIIRTFKNNVCGDDPFRLEMKVGKWSADGKTFNLETETNRIIQAAWEQAGLPENCTVRRDMSRMEMYQCIEASALRDGSIVARHWNGFPNKFFYAIQLVESDRLQESFMGRAENGNQIRFSIERDNWDAPVAYWLLTRHPGDVFGYTLKQSNAWRERVASEEIIHFNNLRDRAEQDVGFPEFDSITQQLHRDRQFDVAHVTAAIWASCKPFFIIQEYPTGMPYVGDPAAMYNQVGGQMGNAEGAGKNQGDGKGGGADKFKSVEPGTGEHLQIGQKPFLVDPKFPIEAATGFKKDNLRATAIGAGLGYHSVSGDYEGLSFSAARAAETPQRDYFKVRQEHFILSFARLHFNEWLKNYLMFGDSGLAFSRYEEFKEAANFHGKRWPYVNPMQDAQTDIMLVEAKLKSRQEVLNESENGRNFVDVVSDLSAEQDTAEAHGIDLNPEVTLATIKKGEPGQLDNPDGTPDVPEKTGGKRA